MIAKIVCRVMGVVFLAIGVAGFFTPDVAGFHVNTAHNIVHIVSGIGALWAGLTSERASKAFSLIFGTVYLLVAVLGFLNVAFVVDLLHVNTPENWLHTAVAAVFLAAGVLSPARLDEPRAIVQATSGTESLARDRATQPDELQRDTDRAAAVPPGRRI